MRAIAHGGLTEVRDFDDVTALPLLPPLWRFMGRWILRQTHSRPGARERVLEKSNGRMDLVALRTKVFDDAWDTAHAGGTRQLVLLGAGLDGRAFRLPNVGDTTVFEVDHPATQELKRRRARGLTSRAGQHVYVPIDFERDRLTDALEAAGHRRDQPTFWLWEGVTPYLTPDAQQATVSAVAASSAPGSRIAMTYVEPPEKKGDVAGIERFVRLLGEPFVGLMSRDVAADRLQRAGLRLVSDSDPSEWRRRFANGAARGPGSFRERIAVGEKGHE
jgi:methyltransferase (TIGR00027 family)